MKILNPVDRLILGHMPFIGVSYQSEEKDEEYRTKFSSAAATRRVLEAASTIGVCKFSAATPRSSPLSPVHLQALQLMIEEGRRVELWPCIGVPVKLGAAGVDAYRRWATYASFEVQNHSEARELLLNDPILNFREGWKNRFIKSRPYAKSDFQKLTIEWDLVDEDLRFFAGRPVGYVEFGSETDFLAMAERFDLIGKLVDSAKDHGYRKVLFGVHHAGVTIPKLEDRLEGFKGFVTPLNLLGVMMFPSKRSAEQAVRNSKKPVFAIKPLAGGRLSPKKAFKYVFKFPVEGCMIGVSSVDELKKDFKVALNVAENT